MNTEPTSPPRISFATSLNARGGVPSDGRLVNAYVEPAPGSDDVVKRPGLSLFRSYLILSRGGGCYYWQGSIYAVVGTIFTKDDAHIGTVGDVMTNGGPYSFASILGATPKLVFHNLLNFYTWDGTTLAMTTAGGHSFLPGLAYLDGTLYAVQSPADLYGSGINDATTWNPLNVIKVQQEPDFALAAYKHRQYVVVFKEWTTEFFWDAGNPVGSPLQQAPGTLLEFGCRHAASIQQFEDLFIWASATRSGSVGVMMLVGMQPQTVSSPAIERILQDANWSRVYSWSGRISGHRFYCLTLPDANISLVYDITTQKWFQWTYGVNQSYFPFLSCTTTADKRVILQHELGDLYTLTPLAVIDAPVFVGGVPPGTNDSNIIVDIYTSAWDGGTRRRKYLQRLEFLCDQTGMRNIDVRWSDDDYQTWSNFRPVDLGQKRPYTEDLGTFYKRSFHLRYNNATAFRIKAAECTNILLGSE